jgi:hypothetical protein
MAELVDAPDSKSGHFGGVGSIPSTPTIIFLFINIAITKDKQKNTTLKAYILKVRPNFSADKPTIAGPNIKPEKAMLETCEIVTGIGSEEILIATLYTIGMMLDVKKPKKIIATKIK